MEEKLARVDLQVVDLAKRYGQELTPEQKRQIDVIKDNVRELDRLQTEQERIASFNREIGDSFSRAFEEGILGAKNFGDVIGSLGQQIERALFSRFVSASINDFIGGFDFGSIFGGGGSGGSATAAAAASSSGGGFFSGLFDALPSFDVGTSRVPRDMLAKIHKNEIIVPAQHAERFREKDFFPGATSAQRSNIVVNVVNNSSAQVQTQARETSNGTQLDVMIDELVSQKIGTLGSRTNQALNAFSQRSLIRR